MSAAKCDTKADPGKEGEGGLEEAAMRFPVETKN
jgi:hypothetical protein